MFISNMQHAAVTANRELINQSHLVSFQFHHSSGPDSVRDSRVLWCSPANTENWKRESACGRPGDIYPGTIAFSNSEKNTGNS